MTYAVLPADVVLEAAEAALAKLPVAFQHKEKAVLSALVALARAVEIHAPMNAKYLTVSLEDAVHLDGYWPGKREPMRISAEAINQAMRR